MPTPQIRIRDDQALVRGRGRPMLPAIVWCARDDEHGLRESVANRPGHGAHPPKPPRHTPQPRALKLFGAARP